MRETEYFLGYLGLKLVNKSLAFQKSADGAVRLIGCLRGCFTALLCLLVLDLPQLMSEKVEEFFAVLIVYWRERELKIFRQGRK